MKKMQKLLALVLALSMVLAMAATATATEVPETGGTIKVTGTTNTTYTVYKMFNIEVTSGGNKYQVTEAWQDFTAEGYFTVVDGYVLWNKNTVSAADGAAVAELATQYVETKNLTSDVTVTVGESVTVAENGYYLLKANDGSTSGVVAVVNGEPVSVTEKTAAEGLPSVEKKVQEDSTQTYGDTNDVDIGQTINFHTTITSGSNASHYVLHDDMAAEIDFTGVTGITRGGNAVPTTDYTVVTGCDDGCDFHVEFSDSFCSGLADNATIVVTYTGKLNELAEVDVGYVNETWLTHTDAAVETNHDTTTTKTYQVKVLKVDQDGKALAGAEFVLKDNIGKYYKVDTDTKEVTWVDTLEEATKYTSDQNGVIIFYGVDAENFILVETRVPGGYTGETDTPVSTKSGRSVEITITNTLGEALPETGGMGTTLFYAVGGLMVLAAVVLLVTKKRMAA